MAVENGPAPGLEDAAERHGEAAETTPPLTDAEVQAQGAARTEAVTKAQAAKEEEAKEAGKEADTLLETLNETLDFSQTADYHTENLIEAAWRKLGEAQTGKLGQTLELKAIDLVLHLTTMLGTQKNPEWALNLVKDKSKQDAMEGKFGLKIVNKTENGETYTTYEWVEPNEELVPAVKMARFFSNTFNPQTADKLMKNINRETKIDAITPAFVQSLEISGNSAYLVNLFAEACGGDPPIIPAGESLFEAFEKNGRANAITDKMAELAETKGQTEQFNTALHEARAERDAARTERATAEDSEMPEYELDLDNLFETSFSVFQNLEAHGLSLDSSFGDAMLIIMGQSGLSESPIGPFLNSIYDTEKPSYTKESALALITELLSADPEYNEAQVNKVLESLKTDSTLLSSYIDGLNEMQSFSRTVKLQEWKDKPDATENRYNEIRGKIFNPISKAIALNEPAFVRIDTVAEEEASDETEVPLEETPKTPEALEAEFLKRFPQAKEEFTALKANGFGLENTMVEVKETHPKLYKQLQRTFKKEEVRFFEHGKIRINLTSLAKKRR